MKDLNLFIKLFSGRTDCLGINQVCLKEKLTNEHYEKHVNGIQRIGVYPIVDNIWTRWAACDIDDGDFSKALNIQSRAKHFNLESYIERSKSKGYHVWVFFDKPVEAIKVRLVFEMILKELEIICELFPKQDEVSENQYGNFIFLPLFGGDVKNDKTIFVDNSGKPFIKDVSGLSKITVNKKDIIEEIIATNELKREEFITPPGGFKPLLQTPPCIETIKREGIKKAQHNEATFRLAIFYRQRNIPQEDVLALLVEWNKKNIKKKTDNPVSEIKTVVDSVFKNNYRAFDCENATLMEYCNKEICPIILSHDKKKAVAEGIITMTHRDASVMVFKKKKYEYRLSNFEFTKSGKFKASLTLSKEKKVVHKDFINLSMASNRKRFVQAAKDEEIDGDLIKLEDMVRKQMEKEEKEKLLKSKQLYIMTEQEKQETISYLESTNDILAKVIDATNRMGVIGEETLRLMVYLCYTSRIMSEPLSITVKGEASSGKSFSCQNIQRLIPEEGYHFITRATANAFYHMAEDGMQHRIIYINELPGSESADYSIRTAQSEGDLILMMPIKDPHTGNMETITKRVKGPVGFMITTTKPKMFNENETRNFSVFSDDSPKLTKKIGSITTRKAMGEEFILDEKEINLWKNVQRLLNPDFKVIIPYAQEVFESFPDKPVRIRRDRERFRVLIEIITILHQYHRRQEKPKEGKMLLISTLADYYAAKVIAGMTLTHTIYEIGPSAEEMWEALKKMEEHRPPEEKSNKFIFKYKDLAEFMGWKTEKVKKWAYALIQLGLIGYAEVEGGGKGGRGKASLLEITKTGGDFSSRSLGFLPNVNTLYDKYPCGKELFYDPFTGNIVDIETAEAPEGLLNGIHEEQKEEAWEE